MVIFTKGELRILNPCCLTCEYVGDVILPRTVTCQLDKDSKSLDIVHLCDYWEINMDIDSPDVKDSDIVITVQEQ